MWTREQQEKAADYINFAYPTGSGPRGMAASLVDLACQRNELLEALKNLLVHELVRDDGDPILTAARDAARAAIEKAEQQ